MVAVLIWHYCGQNCITIAEQGGVFDDDQKTANNGKKK